MSVRLVENGNHAQMHQGMVYEKLNDLNQIPKDRIFTGSSFSEKKPLLDRKIVPIDNNQATINIPLDDIDTVPKAFVDKSPLPSYLDVMGCISVCGVCGVATCYFGLLSAALLISAASVPLEDEVQKRNLFISGGVFGGLCVTTCVSSFCSLKIIKM